MRLLLYPDTFEVRKVYSKIQRYISLMEVEVTHKPTDSFDVAMYWSYHRTVRPQDQALEEISRYYDIINAGCDDITKSRNEAIMKLSFGYNALLYPEYEGKMLMKSQSQGLHDIKIVEGPYKPVPGYIFCKLLDNRIDKNTVRDYRLFVFDGEVALVIEKDKPIKHRFAGAGKADLRIADNAISDEEKRNIKNYCHLHDTHISELDAVRDNGKLYIIDNNNMPAYSQQMKDILEGENIYMLAGKFYETLKRHAR